MTEDIEIKEENVETQEAGIEAAETAATGAEPADADIAAEKPAGHSPRALAREDHRLPKNPRRRPRARAPRVRPEFDQRIIGIRRVTRVVAGGRRFSFSVVIVAGNRKGQVGVGTGKAGDTALAVEKAYRSALKNKVTVSQTEDGSIPHEVEAKYSSGLVKLYPAPGRGVIAGGAVRDVLEMGGIHGVGAKILSRSHNKLNNALAAIKALSMLSKDIKKTKQG
jgi:small subunit ribosomal protein S5